MREQCRDERVTQAVRREPLRDTGLAGIEVEVMPVTAICGELAVRHEKVAVGQVLDHVAAEGI
jgi:hypothetical protein